MKLITLISNKVETRIKAIFIVRIADDGIHPSHLFF